MPSTTSPFQRDCPHLDGHQIDSVHDPEAGATALYCKRCGTAEPLGAAIRRSAPTRSTGGRKAR